MPPKGRKKAYQMPVPLPEGEILKDMRKKEWKLGTPLGEGGFGLIYRAAENTPGKVGEDAPCVVKIEPHENGPLFTELHFYQRAAQSDKVDAWQKQYKMSHLGVPKLFGSGIHEREKVKYRFLVMRRFGDDVWKKYLASKKKFESKTTFALALQILDSLEYLHCNDYAHADIKSANLLLGFSKKDQNKVFLVDFGLVSRYRPDGRHKEYKEDPRKGHNGTPEFTSIDAHKGVAPSRRGDIQILAYVMLQWMCTKLPWEDKLSDLVYVMNQKIKYSTDISGLLKTCFKGSSYPDELKKVFDHAFKLGYDEQPDYDLIRKLCRSVLKREGFKEGSPFDFGAMSASQNGSVTSPKRARANLPKKAPAQAKKRKAPSRERDRSPSQGRKKAKGRAPGPAGEADAATSLPVKKRAGPSKAAVKKAASPKKLGKSPANPKAATPKARKPKAATPKATKPKAATPKATKPKSSPAKKGIKSVGVKAAGTSTPSRTRRQRKIKPEETQSSSTQTTPGLEKRAGARR